MFHITYKTVNLMTGLFYYGQHSTKKLDDGYLGSGVRIKAAIRKYGRHNFKREIMGIHETREEMNAAEIALITPAVLADPLCYNLTTGGSGSHAGTGRRPRRVSLISKTGEEFSGTVAELSAALSIPQKKIYDVMFGGREHYRGFRVAA